MIMTRRLLLLLLLLSPLAARAGEIVLSDVGDRQWQISASGFSNVYALDLYLGYDPYYLSALTTTVEAGLTGALTAINDKFPGTLRLGAASTQPLATNGILLKIQSSTPGAEMVVRQFSVKAVDAEGRVVPTTMRQQLPAQTLVPPSLSDSQAGTIASQPGSTLLGSVTFPVETAKKEEGIELSPAPSLPSGGEQKQDTGLTGSAAQLPALSGPEKRFHSQEGIVTAIERLPQPWTVAAIKAIFLKPATASLARQQPPVVLADGKSKVSLYLPKTVSQQKPSVGVQGCILGSIWDAGEQGWEVELITSKGIWPAKALLLGDGDLIQFPIVIVPTLAVTPPVNESAVIPSLDFDGDKKITARDAYLYVGNLLVR